MADGKPFAAILGATGLAGRHLARRAAVGGFGGVCLSRRPEPPPWCAPAGFSWGALPAGGGALSPASATVFSLVPIAALPPLVARTVPRGGRLIAFSTSGVRFKAESADPRERDLAGRWRRAEAEVRRICEDRGVAWTLFRPTLIYDPGHDRNISAIAAFVRRFGFFPVVRPGAGLRQPIHADDAARAMLAAVSAPGARNALLDLPGGEALTYREMVCRVFESLDRRPRVIPLPLGLARVALHVWRGATGATYSAARLERMNRALTLDPAPVREILGIECRSFHPEFSDDF